MSGDFYNPISFGTDVCNALGLDPGDVTDVTVRIPAQRVPTVTVEMDLMSDNGRGFVRAIRSYKLVPISLPAPTGRRVAGVPPWQGGRLLAQACRDAVARP